MHTLGPWRIVGGTEVRGANGDIVCNTADYRVPTPDMVAIALPDAALIAAAPDLLAALQHALERFEAIPSHRDEIGIYRQSAAIARAAIAKARPLSRGPDQA